jgi:hypothetical protein
MVNFWQASQQLLLALCFSYQLTQNPEVAEKVAQELDEAGLLVTPARPHPRRMEHADLSRLTYLSCVLKACPSPSPLSRPIITRNALSRSLFSSLVA